MKKKILLWWISLTFSFAFTSFGQSLDDYNKIIQKCIDLPAIQQYYTMANGIPNQLYILYHGLDFPANIAVSKFNKSVLFTSKQGLTDNNLDVWLLFRELNVNGQKASVEYRVYYMFTKDPEKHVIINLEFTKSGSNWIVSKSKTEERSL